MLTSLFQEIACFSYDEQHEYHPDARSLRYYFPARLGADLSRGFEQFNRLDDTKDEHIDSLLKTLMLLEEKTGKKVDTDFVTWVMLPHLTTECMPADRGRLFDQARHDDQGRFCLPIVEDVADMSSSRSWPHPATTCWVAGMSQWSCVVSEHAHGT